MSAILLRRVEAHWHFQGAKNIKDCFISFQRVICINTIPAKQASYIYLLLYQILNCQASITKLKWKINEYFMCNFQRDKN